jgi:ABC-2 type transport system ATP-binding protein
METIRVENLCRSFDALRAVDGLTFTVHAGEIFGLVGPDGAGKTTTMRLLAGVLTPTSGDAWVAGHHIVKDSEALKEEIGYMSQRFGLYADLTVQENIDFYADIYGVPRKGRGEKVDRLLSFSNLTPFRKRLAGNLSGGMKQKLGLACALIHTPKVLFLDEPTNGVDPVSRRDFWKILYQLLRDGVTLFVSTAYLDEAERCGRVALIHKGRILSIGTPHEVKQIMRGGILEVEVEEPRSALRILRERMPGASVNLFGRNIHVATADPTATTARMETIFRDSGRMPPHIRPREPSLEDVFVSAVTEGDAARSEEQRP